MRQGEAKEIRGVNDLNDNRVRGANALGSVPNHGSVIRCSLE